MKNLVILILETISSVRWCLLASAFGHLGVKGRRGNASSYRGTLALHRIQRKRVKYEEFYVDSKRRGGRFGLFYRNCGRLHFAL